MRKESVKKDLKFGFFVGNRRMIILQVFLVFSLFFIFLGLGKDVGAVAVQPCDGKKDGDKCTGDTGCAAEEGTWQGICLDGVCKAPASQASLQASLVDEKKRDCNDWEGYTNYSGRNYSFCDDEKEQGCCLKIGNMICTNTKEAEECVGECFFSDEDTAGYKEDYKGNEYCERIMPGSYCFIESGSGTDNSDPETGGGDTPLTESGNTTTPGGTDYKHYTSSFKNEKYKNLENIPGQDRTPDLPVYLNNLYKFGIAISAILAFVMISYASFIIMVSGAGNAGKIGDAKTKITDAIIGLILALGSYLLLFIINPDLVDGTISSIPNIGEVSSSGSSGSSGSSSNNSGYQQACKNNDHKGKIDYNKSSGAENFSNSCNDLSNFFNEYDNIINIDGVTGKCILKTLAHLETTCGSNNTKSSAGAYGLMQLLPSTAKEFCEKCDCPNDVDIKTALEKDKGELSICLAAHYVNNNGSKVLGAGLTGDDLIAGIFAGYNSGYGGEKSNGKKASLAESKDCEGARAFQCCTNPGGLDESIGHAWRGVSLYKQCMGGK